MAQSRQPRLAAAGTALATALALATAPAAAQTRFAWPDTAVDVAQYPTVEQCLAATARVRRGLERHEALTVWRDTMPRDPREALEPAPALVTETARRCAARFTESSADRAEFAPLLRLYLAAGRDADAAALVARRMAAVPAKDTAVRVAVGDTAVDAYLNARPERLDAIEKILVERAHDGTDRVRRIAVYHKLLNAAELAGDTARVRSAARRLVAVADSLTPAERESEEFERLGAAGGKVMIYDAMQKMMGIEVMLDSLRSGTPALVALLRAMWTASTGGRAEAMPLPTGEHAPTITADYWFPSTAGSTPRPVPGHVSLVLFLDHEGCLDWYHWGRGIDGCTGQLIGLRRLSERFPALDITLVARTHGSFVYAPPMTPAAEADLLRQWLAPYHFPRLTVAVTSTPFWNLPSPDGRRIDKPTANRTHYDFGRTSLLSSGIYLVDQDGIIAFAAGPGNPALEQFIEVLMNRRMGGEHAAK